MDKYTKEEVEEILRKFANEVDELYRPYTRNNTLGWEYLENFLKEIKNYKK